MHHDHDDHVHKDSVGSLNDTGDVYLSGDAVNFKLCQANNIEDKFRNLQTNIRPHKDNFSSSSSKCHVDTPMAHPRPQTYYNSQTGTSIVHICSNSSVSNTVRANSNYIDKQWAILKEKMLPTVKSNPKTEVDNIAIISEFVEEKCEVDFSFIDEPNGNESDNNHAKYLDSCKSKISSHVSNSLRNVNDSNDKNSVRYTDDSFPSSSISMQISNESQKLLNKSDCEVITAPLNSNIKRDKPDNLRHSFIEKFNKDRNSDNICRKSLTLEPTLLVPSFRDEFLSDMDPTHLRSSKEPIQKREYSSLVSSQPVENVTPYKTVSVTSSTCGVNPNSVEKMNCLSPHDVTSKETDQDEPKNSETKSKKYQEMQLRMSKKREKNLITRASKSETYWLLPDYKGNNSLEEIINFINKDIKEASTTVPQKNNKKLKKKAIKKDSLNCLVNSNECQQNESCPSNSEERNEQLNEKVVVYPNNISIQLNSEVLSSSLKKCSEEQEFRPMIFANKVEPLGSLKNSVDNEQFSVVKKKKKSKKSVYQTKEIHPEKLLGSSSNLIESVIDHTQSDFCFKTLKNMSNTNMKESISINESNISKSKDCHSFVKEVVVLKPMKNGLIPTSNNVTDKLDFIGLKLSEFCESRKICKNISVCSQKSSNMASLLSNPDDFPPIKSYTSLNTKEKTQKVMPKIELIQARKASRFFSFSKSKSAFNLKHAQAFMNSTYQEVMKSEGYILYNQNI